MAYLIRGTSTAKLIGVNEAANRIIKGGKIACYRTAGGDAALLVRMDRSRFGFRYLRELALCEPNVKFERQSSRRAIRDAVNAGRLVYLFDGISDLIEGFNDMEFWEQPRREDDDG